jgi:hypothetical protein
MTKDKSLTKNYKTISIYPKINKDYHQIFKFMTAKSKNVFNIYMYHYKVYNLFKNIIFKNIFEHINKNKNNYPVDIIKKTKEEIKTDKINKKQNKKKNLPNDKISLLIYQEYDKYYNQYKTYQEIVKSNNNIIYQFIKNKFTNIILDNTNFDYFYKDFISNQIPNTIYDYENKYIVYDSIIFRILKSMYLHNFKKYQNCIFNNIPIKETINEKFIEAIKNNEIITNNYIKDDYKKKLKEAYFVSSDQNAVERICFKYNFNDDSKENYLRSHQKKNTMSKAFNSIKSFFATIGKVKNPRMPKFKDKNDLFPIIFDDSCFRLENNVVSIALGKYVSQNFNSITNKNYVKLNQTFKKNKKGILKSNENILYVDEKFMSIKTKENKKKNHYIVNNLCINKNNANIIEPFYFKFKIPSNINKIINVQLIPLNYGNTFKLNVCYEAKLNFSKLENTGKIISIDLGVKNLMTIYDSEGEQIILSGNYINHLNYKYNEKLDKMKSILKKVNNKDVSKRYYNLLEKRTRTINNYFDIVAKWLITKYNNVEIFVFGYNVNCMDYVQPASFA